MDIKARLGFKRSHKLIFSKTLVNCNKIVICLPREHLRVVKNSLKCVCTFQIEVEFGSVGFKKRGKPEYLEKNLSE